MGVRSCLELHLGSIAAALCLACSGVQSPVGPAPTDPRDQFDLGDPNVSLNATAVGPVAAAYHVAWWEASLQDFSVVPDASGYVPPSGEPVSAVVFFGHAADGTPILDGQLVMDGSTLDSIPGSTLDDLGSVFVGSNVQARPFDPTQQDPLPDTDKAELLASVVDSLAALPTAASGTTTPSARTDLHVLGNGGGPHCDVKAELSQVAKVFSSAMGAESACKTCGATLSAILVRPRANKRLLGMNAPADPTSQDMVMLKQLGVNEVRIGVTLPNLGSSPMTAITDRAYWDPILSARFQQLAKTVKAYHDNGMKVLVTVGAELVPQASASDKAGGGVYHSYCDASPADCDPNSQGCSALSRYWATYDHEFQRRLGMALGAFKQNGATPDEFEAWNEPDSRGAGKLKEACYVSLATDAVSTIRSVVPGASITSGIAGVQYYCDLSRLWGYTGAHGTAACKNQPNQLNVGLTDPLHAGKNFGDEAAALLKSFSSVNLHPYNDWPGASTDKCWNTGAYAGDYRGSPLKTTIDDLEAILGDPKLELGSAPLTFTEWGNQADLNCNPTKSYPGRDREMAAYIDAMFRFLRGRSPESKRVSEAFFFSFTNDVCPMGLTYYNDPGGTPQAADRVPKVLPFTTYELERVADDPQCASCVDGVLPKLKGQLPHGCPLPPATAPLPAGGSCNPPDPDAGAGGLDAGGGADGGSGNIDAGQGTIDAGQGNVDAGQGSVDAGQSGVDAGQAGTCSPGQNGVFCGRQLGASDPDSVFECIGGLKFDLGPCGGSLCVDNVGCVYPDASTPPSGPCANLPDNTYCGSSIGAPNPGDVYDCVSGETFDFGACPNGWTCSAGVCNP